MKYVFVWTTKLSAVFVPRKAIGKNLVEGINTVETVFLLRIENRIYYNPHLTCSQIYTLLLRIFQMPFRPLKMIICSFTCSSNRKLCEKWYDFVDNFHNTALVHFAKVCFWDFACQTQLHGACWGQSLAVCSSFDTKPKPKVDFRNEVNIFALFLWSSFSTAIWMLLMKLMYRLVQITRSGWTVLLAWSRAFTKACFSAVLICMIFLLTGARLSGRRCSEQKIESEGLLRCGRNRGRGKKGERY